MRRRKKGGEEADEGRREGQAEVTLRTFSIEEVLGLLYFQIWKPRMVRLELAQAVVEEAVETWSSTRDRHHLVFPRSILRSKI